MIALMVATAATVAGCSSAPAAPPDPFPPRPAEIDIERLDPCALVGARARADLRVGTGRPATAVSSGTTTRACGWGSLDTPFDYSVQLIPQDAADAVGAPGAVVGTIAGYGTVRIVEREATYPLCEILVDVGEAQLMRIQVQTVERQRGSGAPYPVDQVCAQADAAATEALESARRRVS
ncbi:hypothetical protein AD006_22975 [Pseudonocardia sp. EC080610-09]|nr:hypothetical protein FRP1_15320 [Pseudonocardia sp. EC080625-04]ALL77457.1 hypothetical protein AD006_22975 [Pseudonocardia sp. EC080610-09]ALL80372.1 hypothetical protein AD017_02565 [Pseudonocardia sp. EC080619-01]